MTTRRTRFYKTAGGAAVFENELRALGPLASAAVSEAMRRHARGESLPREVKKVRRAHGKLIQELRVTYGSNEYRVLFVHLAKEDHIMLGLTALQKTTNRLPEADVERAVQRLGDWLGRRRID